VLNQLLAQSNLNLGVLDNMGHTPLWVAMVAQNYKIVHMLREKGAPVQPDIAVPLCKAAARNDVNFLEMLLMHNIDFLSRVLPSILADTSSCLYLAAH
jgi:ankyrin repeat protein